jgi:anti-anti-sigma factor
MALLYRHNEIGLGVVKLNGALLGSQADEALDMFRGLIQQGIQQVVVDLADVSFIDSLGLAALAAGYRLFGSRPENFRLAALQEQPQLVFDLTGFKHIIPTFETMLEALTDQPARPLSAYHPSGYSQPVSNLVQPSLSTFN